MLFKKFIYKQNRKFFGKLHKVVKDHAMSTTNCKNCMTEFEFYYDFKTKWIPDTCASCFIFEMKIKTDICEKCKCEFPVREDDKVWPRRCVNCIFEW